MYISKGLLTHDDIMKMYRIIQYSKDIFKCNMYVWKRSHFYSKKYFLYNE